MKTVAIALSLAAFGFAGTAQAERTFKPGHDQTLARADVLGRSTQVFARLDVNKDGKLDPTDREARRLAMFDRADANKDGQISRTEFTELRPQMRWPGMSDGANAQGQSMGGHRMGRGGMGGQRMGGMMLMRMADANRDGAVTSDEFAAAAASRFDAADSNKDGQLTPAERQAAKGAMRERMRSMMQRGAAPAAN